MCVCFEYVVEMAIYMGALQILSSRFTPSDAPYLQRIIGIYMLGQTVQTVSSCGVLTLFC